MKELATESLFSREKSWCPYSRAGLLVKLESRFFLVKGPQVMAERKSTRVVNARKKALEAARSFAEREERLLGLAEDFFKLAESSGAETVEKKIEEYQLKIEQLRQELVQLEKSSELDQAKVIARFKAEGVGQSETASRLALSAGEVRRLAKLVPEAEASE